MSRPASTCTAARLTLSRGSSEGLEEIATARVKDAYRQLGSPCFVENTSLALEGHGQFTGAAFKKEFAALGEVGFARKYGGAQGLTRVVLAYTDGGDVQLFEGQIEGALLTS